MTDFPVPVPRTPDPETTADFHNAIGLSAAERAPIASDLAAGSASRSWLAEDHRPE